LFIIIAFHQLYVDVFWGFFLGYIQNHIYSSCHLEHCEVSLEEDNIESGRARRFERKSEC